MTFHQVVVYDASLGTKSYISCGLLLDLNPLSANSTKWSKTLKQFVGNIPGVGA